MSSRSRSLHLKLAPYLLQRCFLRSQTELNKIPLQGEMVLWSVHDHLSVQIIAPLFHPYLSIFPWLPAGFSLAIILEMAALQQTNHFLNGCHTYYRCIYLHNIWAIGFNELYQLLKQIK